MLAEMRVVWVGEVIAEVSASALMAVKGRVENGVRDAGECVSFTQAAAGFALLYKLGQAGRNLDVVAKPSAQRGFIAEQPGGGPHSVLQVSNLRFDELCFGGR